MCPVVVPTQPVAVSYKQQQWQQITDCTGGDCTFYKDTIHPVGFLALNSHATYPMTSKEIVFQKLEANFIVDLQSVVAVDRTVYYDNDGNFWYFEPVQDNVLLCKVVNLHFDTVGDNDMVEYWNSRTWSKSYSILRVFFSNSFTPFSLQV